MDIFLIVYFNKISIMDDRIILDKVSDNIRLARLQQRLSQEKLAEMVDISTKYLNMIENRKANPTIVIVVKICIALKISLNTIYPQILQKPETL